MLELHAELINFNVKYFEIVSPNLNISNTRKFGGGYGPLFLAPLLREGQHVRKPDVEYHSKRPTVNLEVVYAAWDAHP